MYVVESTDCLCVAVVNIHAKEAEGHQRRCLVARVLWILGALSHAKVVRRNLVEQLCELKLLKNVFHT